MKPAELRELLDAIAFLERLSDRKNWTDGYPSNPAICNDFNVEKGCFTARIYTDASKHSKILKKILKKENENVSEN